MPLHKEDLDRATAKGCHVTGCTHVGHDHLFLSPACHVNGGARVNVDMGLGVLYTFCAVCLRDIADIKLEECTAFGDNGILRSSCKCANPTVLDVAYWMSKAEIAVSCRKCEHPVGRAKVKALH